MKDNNLDDCLSTSCIFCHKSEEQAMCDILLDAKCDLNICTLCFKAKK